MQRPRLPRLTTRRLMALVAIVAILLAGGIIGRRWWDFSTRARYHAVQAWANGVESANSFELAYDDIRSGRSEASARPFAEQGSKLHKVSFYHDALRRKYENAMWRPWLPVPPDPPPP